MEEEPFGLPCFAEYDEKILTLRVSLSLSFTTRFASKILRPLPNPKAPVNHSREGNSSLCRAAAVPLMIFTPKKHLIPEPPPAMWALKTHQSVLKTHRFLRDPEKAPQSCKLTPQPAALGSPSSTLVMLHPGWSGCVGPGLPRGPTSLQPHCPALRKYLSALVPIKTLLH